MSQLAWYKQMEYWRDMAVINLTLLRFPNTMTKAEIEAERKYNRKVKRAMSRILDYMALPTVYEFENMSG